MPPARMRASMPLRRASQLSAAWALPASRQSRGISQAFIVASVAAARMPGVTIVPTLRKGAWPWLLAAVAACTPVRAPLVAYTCEGGVRLDVRFERDHALISLPGGGQVRLPQQVA